MPERLDIVSLRSRTKGAPAHARLHAQAEEVTRKDSANGKPYFELRLRDGNGSLTLRAWNDTPAYAACEALPCGAAVEVEGEFYQNGSFGLDAKRWSVRALEPDEAAALFAGDEEAQANTAAQLKFLEETVSSLADPRLKGLCSAFLRDFGPRFSRAAAARMNHHARRGGLLAHTAQMMRAAMALATAYPQLNRDLLCAGVLFHDSGKLWETCPAEEGFEIPREMRGELLGHISIGIELVNTLWRSLPLEEWKMVKPPSEDVRMHLLHLVAAHHGQLEFGSPVLPKTPEAIALHYIDNLDARLEMLSEAWVSQPLIAPGIHERVRTLGVNPVTPLPPHTV